MSIFQLLLTVNFHLGELFIVDKKCSRCPFIGPLSEFVKDDRFLLGVRPECKGCYNTDRRKWRLAYSEDRRKLKNQKLIARHKERYHSDPVFRQYVCRKAHETKIRTQFDLEPTDIESLQREQNNKCAICQREFLKRPHIDHIHGTKIVRGLLCGSCNRGIGLLQESSQTLSNAITYLEKWNVEVTA
jgi:Recombination endonuclease VII